MINKTQKNMDYPQKTNNSNVQDELPGLEYIETIGKVIIEVMLSPKPITGTN